MESVQRNARLQLPGAQDGPDETQEADEHPPAGNWRDHVPRGHLQGDECLPQHFSNPLHTTLVDPHGRMNAAALLNASSLGPAVRQAIQTQAVYMQARNEAAQALPQVQAELVQAEGEFNTAQRALEVAHGMAGDPTEVELSRVNDAVEQLRRRVDELASVKGDLETNQRLVDQGHVHLEARLQGRDPNYRWHHSKANRVAVYALATAIGLAVVATSVGFGEEAINRGYTDRIERVDLRLGPLQLGDRVGRVTADREREIGPELPGERATGYAEADQWRVNAQLFDQLVPPYVAVTMFLVVFAVEVIYRAVHNQRFGQQ